MEPRDFETVEDLIAECKRRYPVGSYFICAIEEDDICLVTPTSYEFEIDDDDGCLQSVSSECNPDITNVGQESVDFGVCTHVMGKLDEGYILSFMVRRNKWAVPCTKYGESIFTIPKAQVNNKFNIGDVVQVCSKSSDTTPGGGVWTGDHLSKILGVSNMSGRIINIHYRTNESIAYYEISGLGSCYIDERCLILISSHIQSSIKTSQHDKIKESSTSCSSGSAKVRRPNQQISVAAPIRGIGLKGSGSKIKLGGNNRYH